MSILKRMIECNYAERGKPDSWLVGCRLVVLRFNATLTAKVISWRSVTHMCFLASFLTYFCRGDKRKYAGKKSRLNRGSNSQPPGHESDTLTTEPPGQGPIHGCN